MENENYQQTINWLHENKDVITTWIDGLADALQILALNDCGAYRQEQESAIFQVAGTREFLQKLRMRIEN